jgi:hypothetical protein
VPLDNALAMDCLNVSMIDAICIAFFSQKYIIKPQKNQNDFCIWYKPHTGLHPSGDCVCQLAYL